MLTGQMITFGQAVRCATVEALPLAVEAGATTVICPPELAGAVSERGLVPLVESPAPAAGGAGAAWAIPVEGADARLVERPAASPPGRLGLPRTLRDQLDGHGRLRPRAPWASGGELAPAPAPGRRFSTAELTRGVRPALAGVLERAGAGERP